VLSQLRENLPRSSIRRNWKNPVERAFLSQSANVLVLHDPEFDEMAQVCVARQPSGKLDHARRKIARQNVYSTGAQVNRVDPCPAVQLQDAMARFERALQGARGDSPAR